MEKEERFLYFSALKGLAILLVVIGHATSGLVYNYCYSYHLALFFTVTGFLYNEKKYGWNPALNFGNRVKSNWSKFVIYTSLIGLLHFFIPLFEKYNFIGGKWDLYTLRNYVLNNMVMTNTESLCGAMWFVAPLIVAAGLLGLIVYIGNIVQKNFNRQGIKHIIIVLLTILCLYLGYERIVIKLKLGFRLDISLFVMPLLTIGYYLNTYIRDFRKYLKAYIAIPCIVISFLLSKKGFTNSLNGQAVELKQFYLLAVLGIYQSMYIIKFICRSAKSVARVLGFLGKYTFEIMAFHFLIFKLCDIVWYIFTNDTRTDVFTAFPRFYNIWWLYIPLGCALPAIGKWLFDKGGCYYKRKFLNSKKLNSNCNL